MTAVAVIVPADDRPGHLALCLDSLYGQTHPDFEILVADTGTNTVNDAVVEHHEEHCPQRVRHIHAPGAPQNLARALDAALLSTEAEYVMFLGGRCIAGPGFVAAHLAGADYGYFVHGETLPLDEPLTRALETEGLDPFRTLGENWLGSISPEWRRRHLAASPVTRLRHWLRKDTPGLQYWNCETSSCFRDDLLAINGFDMDVDDGRQNRDLANRLQNNGLEPRGVGPDGRVFRLFDPGRETETQSGGRIPARLEPGGEVRAVMGAKELAAGVSLLRGAA